MQISIFLTLSDIIETSKTNARGVQVCVIVCIDSIYRLDTFIINLNQRFVKFTREDGNVYINRFRCESKSDPRLIRCRNLGGDSLVRSSQSFLRSSKNVVDCRCVCMCVTWAQNCVDFNSSLLNNCTMLIHDFWYTSVNIYNSHVTITKYMLAHKHI